MFRGRRTRVLRDCMHACIRVRSLDTTAFVLQRLQRLQSSGVCRLNSICDCWHNDGVVFFLTLPSLRSNWHPAFLPHWPPSPRTREVGCTAGRFGRCRWRRLWCARCLWRRSSGRKFQSRRSFRARCRRKRRRLGSRRARSCPLVLCHAFDTYCSFPTVAVFRRKDFFRLPFFSHLPLFSYCHCFLAALFSPAALFRLPLFSACSFFFQSSALFRLPLFLLPTALFPPAAHLSHQLYFLGVS